MKLRGFFPFDRLRVRMVKTGGVTAAGDSSDAKFH
jgi:hypothetical protein